MPSKNSATVFKLDGAEALKGLLNEFPVRIQRDILNSAGRAGAGVIKKEVKKNIKAKGLIKTGRLYKGISVKKASGRHGVFYIYSKSPVGHLLEYGTVSRKLNEPHKVKLKSGVVMVSYTGQVKATPFFRPAIDENKQEVVKAIMVRAAKRMAAESEKMTRKWGTMSKSYRRKLEK